jgi:hypothetical protein
MPFFLSFQFYAKNQFGTKRSLYSKKKKKMMKKKRKKKKRRKKKDLIRMQSRCRF